MSTTLNHEGENMHFGDREIEQLVESIWSAVLGWEVTPGSETSGWDEDFLTGYVPITGAWDGAVLLECHRDLARLAAATMFSLDAAAVGLEEVRDTLSELTNMLGGNLKALLPGPCFLGVPKVVNGHDCTVRVLDTRVLHQVGFSSQGLPFLVRVLQRQPAAA
jgi:chemotaxis protein CheX